MPQDKKKNCLLWLRLESMKLKTCRSAGNDSLYTKLSYPAVTHLKHLSAQHKIELSELFRNLDTHSEHYAELVA